MTVGTRPTAGFGTVDGEYIRGLSNGNNDTYISGLTAKAGGTQAAASQLPNQYSLYEFDTVATSNDSTLLPFAAAGARKKIFNNGAATLAIYASPNNNKLTGSPDVINKTANASSYTLTTGQAAEFFCAKNGIWAAIKTA